eukprot:gb/GEZN01006497.1/.p1 GENE.gb/GEZN01006497.1/~~gb/GEZN01006497.1/.p1  ORF type:complete len:479 (+),score=29.51 gb/GEZN01006497.1/:176-1612(+)
MRIRLIPPSFRNRRSLVYRNMEKICRKVGDCSKLLLFLCLWYASSATGTALSKLIVDHFHSPVLLSQCHLLASGMGDGLVLWMNGRVPKLDLQLVRLSFPVALGMTLCKTFTYVSYSFITPSLTQTVKASAPIFTVLFMTFYGNWPSLRLFFTLIPICMGVAIAALTEQYFHFLGFHIAVASALAQVWQTLVTKKSFRLMPDGPDPILFHFYCSMIGFVLQAPYLLVTEIRDIMNNNPPADQNRGEFSLKWFFLSVALGYASNIFSLLFLSRVDILSHSVANTMKRLVTIVTSVLYFDSPVTSMNVIGMLLALFGFFWYSYENSILKASKMFESRSKAFKPSLNNVNDDVYDTEDPLKQKLTSRNDHVLSSHCEDQTQNESEGHTHADSRRTLNVHVHNHITNISMSTEATNNLLSVPLNITSLPTTPHKGLKKSFSTSDFPVVPPDNIHHRPWPASLLKSSHVAKDLSSASWSTSST